MTRAGSLRRVLAAVVVGALAAIVIAIIRMTPAAAGQSIFTTAGEQTFVVPTGVTSLHVTLIGAPGANGGSGSGSGGTAGNGSQVTADVPVMSGETLYVEVGGAGSGTTGGFNGGANATSSSVSAGGGGGATDIRTIDQNTVGTLGSRLIVAGGGGGGGAAGDFSAATGGGGGAGGPIPSAGLPGGTVFGTYHGGGGGQAGAFLNGGTHGAGGTGGIFSGHDGSDGSSGTGGIGGSPATLASRGGGGGGGGGYYGGGGGGSGTNDFPPTAGGGGGGAGSNYLTGTGVTNASASADSTGAAEVDITWADPLPTVTSVAPNSGPVGGGGTAQITITGTNFVAGATVSFGGTAGTNVLVLGSTFIKVTPPAHSPGTVHVTVTTAAGTSAQTSADEFTFVAAPSPSGSTTPSSSPTPSSQPFPLPPVHVFVPARVPSAPTVTVSAGLGSVTVFWTAPSDNDSPITSYIVTPIKNGAIQTGRRFGADLRKARFSNLTPGARYVFAVAAVNAIGVGPAGKSPVVIPMGPPGQPTGVSAVVSADTATVSWSAPADDGGSPITGYAITPILAGTAQSPTTFDDPATTHTVSGLTSGGQYTFQVAAINAAGTGQASSESNLVTVSADAQVGGADPGTDPAALAMTGVNAAGIALVGSCALLAGIALLVYLRIRRPRSG
jgi:Fibronectin type III domain/IPT/TIG domain